MKRCQLSGDCSNHHGHISAADAAVIILRSRDKLWDAARKVSEERGEGSVNAADVHDVLIALTRQP